MCLFKGIPLAVIVVTAGFNAVFKVSNFERINEVTLTLESPMTIKSRTPDKGWMHCIRQENKKLTVQIVSLKGLNWQQI